MRPRLSTFKTETRPRHWTLKTETFHFPKLSRSRRDVQSSTPRRDRDVPKNVSRPQCRSLKTLTGEVCHLTTCFLRVRSIIFFVIYPQAWCIAWMFTRLKSRDRDRDVISSRLRRDWDVLFFQTLETETFNLQDRDETRCSKKRLETETFKTETTSLVALMKWLTSWWAVCCSNRNWKLTRTEQRLLLQTECICMAEFPQVFGNYILC